MRIEDQLGDDAVLQAKRLSLFLSPDGTAVSWKLQLAVGVILLVLVALAVPSVGSVKAVLPRSSR